MYHRIYTPANVKDIARSLSPGSAPRHTVAITLDGRLGTGGKCPSALEVVLRTGPRGFSAAWSVEVIQLWTEAHVVQRWLYPGPGPWMPFVLWPWKHTVKVGLQ